MVSINSTITKIIGISAYSSVISKLVFVYLSPNHAFLEFGLVYLSELLYQSNRTIEMSY